MLDPVRVCPFTGSLEKPRISQHLDFLVSMYTDININICSMETKCDQKKLKYEVKVNFEIYVADRKATTCI